MKMGIITRNENGWCSTQLRESMRKMNITPICFSFHHLIARIKYGTEASVGTMAIMQDLSALITRPIGRGSLEQIIFRMDLLHKLELSGMLVINPATSIERSVDKYYALALLERSGVSVPRTAVTENYEEAMKCFKELGGDVVVKPLFGSRGVGSTRISDPNVAERVFRTISFYHGILYLQEFIQHGVSDIRAFVVGDHVVASMYRVSESWKTNVSLGAKPISVKLNEELEKLALNTAKTIGCKIAGIDILEGPKGPVVVELNSQPGWRGLQSVSRVNISDEIISYILSELKE